MENRNGIKTLWAVVIAAGSLLLNSGLFVIHRLFEIDQQQLELRVAIEQRLLRVESKIDQLGCALGMSLTETPRSPRWRRAPVRDPGRPVPPALPPPAPALARGSRATVADPPRAPRPGRAAVE